MKITFFSNFLNHHQLPFCQEMVKILGNEFKFVATERIPVERVNLGYEDMNEKYNFVVCSYKNENEAFKLGIESDIVIIGSAPDKYIKQRLKQKKIIFRYSERIFKNGFKLKSFLSILLKRTVLERNKTYLLCASAYSTYDYNLAGAYKNKTFSLPSSIFKFSSILLKDVYVLVVLFPKSNAKLYKFPPNNWLLIINISMINTDISPGILLFVFFCFFIYCFFPLAYLYHIKIILQYKRTNFYS